MEEEFENLSKDELLNRTVIESVITLKNAEIRERMLAKLETRAKELKILQNFKRLYKAIQAEIIQQQKQLNSYVTEFTRAPIKLKCKNYICNDLGVVKSEFNQVLMTSVDTVVCTHPILPVERLINVDTNTEKVKLAFYKDKKWQTVIAEKNTLASKNKILQLANTGIEVNENNAKELIIYISDLLTINTETIPCNKAITHLGWTENEFIPYTQDYKFDGDRSFESIFKDIKEKGDYEIWRETVKNLRQRSETLHFIVASSFASVLIEILHINPFIVHLWGKSGTGKTVALIIAMSVWGNPKVGQLVKNLNSTNVGLERLSAFLNNIPFAGDELQTIKNKYTDFNELIYKLTRGEGKSRGTVDGGIAEQLKWNCAFLTTGEEPITSEYSKEGVKNRVIEIEENNKIVKNGKEVVNILVNNYGFAGKDFINNLPSVEELQKRHTEIFNKLNEKYSSTGKQTNAIATVLLADELVSKNIFFDNPLTIEQAEKYFTKDIDEAERIYNLIVDWLFANINKFEGYSNTETWGKYIATGEENERNIQYFYINNKTLKDFLKSNNISFDGIKSKLLDKGILERNSQGRFTHYTSINGKMQNLIKFNLLKENTIEELPF
nr:MAG TPA: active helicase ring shaped helicase [Caudoviricetes sp.]